MVNEDYRSIRAAFLRKGAGRPEPTNLLAVTRSSALSTDVTAVCQYIAGTRSRYHMPAHDRIHGPCSPRSLLFALLSSSAHKSRCALPTRSRRPHIPGDRLADRTERAHSSLISRMLRPSHAVIAQLMPPLLTAGVCLQHLCHTCAGREDRARAH